MKVIEEWMELKVVRYGDGNYEAYEALSDSKKETANLSSLRQWLRTLVDDTILEIEAARNREEE